MQATRVALGVLAMLVSAFPLAWMAILGTVQFANLWMSPPYWQEFAAIAAFWIGFVASVVFFRSCLKQGLQQASSWPFLLLILFGLGGGIAEEVMLLSNPKTSFPIGFFALAPISWVVAGAAAAQIAKKWNASTRERARE